MTEDQRVVDAVRQWFKETVENGMIHPASVGELEMLLEQTYQQWRDEQMRNLDFLAAYREEKERRIDRAYCIVCSTCGLRRKMREDQVGYQLVRIAIDSGVIHCLVCAGTVWELEERA